MGGAPRMADGVGVGALELDRQQAERDRRFAAFADAHRDRAVRMAWRLVGGDSAAAEDVAQEALLRAYRALPRFREESSLETWFYRILIRQAANHRRWAGIRRIWSAPDGPSFDPEDPQRSGPGDAALRRRIAEALEGLSRRQRETFVLVHLEGYTVAEAAELLGTPPGTLKSHLHRALVSLRRTLSDVWETAEAMQGGSRS